jgi:hypothetical protein
MRCDGKWLSPGSLTADLKMSTNSNPALAAVNGTGNLSLVLATLAGERSVRSLLDESYNLILIEDGCAVGTDELHQQELEILSMIYCYVMRSDDVSVMLNYLKDK